MTTNEARLLEELTKELRPVPPMESTAKLFVKWSLFATVFVAAEFALTGGYRPNAFQELTVHPRFLLETCVAVLMVYTAGWSAIALRIPDDERPRWVRALPMALLALFSVLVALDFISPSLASTDEHERYFCAIWISVFGAVPAWVLYRFVAKGATVESKWTGNLIGLASMGLPTALMQLGCMYSPVHVLLHHVIPLWLSMLIVGEFMSERLSRWSVQRTGTGSLERPRAGK